MNRLLRFLDPVFGVALAAALAMVVITAWPLTASAAERTVGSGESATDVRSLAEFSALRVTGVDVRVRSGDARSATVQADRNLLPLLETRIEDGRDGKTLVVGWQRGSSVKTQVRPQVTLTLPTLAALAVVGSGDVKVEPLKVARLAVRVEGSGDIQFDGLTADELSLSIGGSGDIQATGRAPRLSVSIAGSGDVKTDGLKADEVSVSIAGSGDAAVNAERTLSVSIAGAGDVVYTGAAVLKKSVAGSGSVTRR